MKTQLLADFKKLTLILQQFLWDTSGLKQIVSNFDIAVHRVIEGFFDFVDMDLPCGIDDIEFFFVYRTLYFGKTAFIFGVV